MRCKGAGGRSPPTGIKIEGRKGAGGRFPPISIKIDGCKGAGGRFPPAGIKIEGCEGAGRRFPPTGVEIEGCGSAGEGLAPALPHLFTDLIEIFNEYISFWGKGWRHHLFPSILVLGVVAMAN